MSRDGLDLSAIALVHGLRLSGSRTTTTRSCPNALDAVCAPPSWRRRRRRRVIVSPPPVKSLRPRRAASRHTVVAGQMHKHTHRHTFPQVPFEQTEWSSRNGASRRRAHSFLSSRFRTPTLVCVCASGPLGWTIAVVRCFWPCLTRRLLQILQQWPDSRASVLSSSSSQSVAQVSSPSGYSQIEFSVCACVRPLVC